MHRKYIFIQHAADGVDGEQLGVADHVMMEFIVYTEDNMGEGHVEDGNRIPVDVTSKHALVSK